MKKSKSYKKSKSHKSNRNGSQESSFICTYYKNKNGMGGVAIPITTNQANSNAKNNNHDLNIIIDSRSENFALHHDEVEVVLKSKFKQNNEAKIFGSIVKILKHNTKNLVGRIITHKDKFYLDVNNSKFGKYLVKLTNVPNNFDPQELFNTTISSFPSDSEPFFGAVIVNSIGKVDEDRAFIMQNLIEADVPIEFNKNTLTQANKYPEALSPNDLTNRDDLRNLPFVTIDGEDAKDFDDAVFCSIDPKTEHFHLYVAIADVAHYVTPDSPLDDEAYLRGTSIYFPKQVIPMLPEQLSNNLCSLVPNQDRLVMYVQIAIDQTGNMLDYHVANGVINSKSRLTYNIVSNWIADPTQIPGDLQENITNLYKIFKTLLQARNQRGAIDFDSVEPFFRFDKDGIVCDIKPRARLESHQLIEECMLMANVAVANFMLKHKQPALFRIHEKPSQDKFNALKAYLNSLAIEFDVDYGLLNPTDYYNLIKHVHNHPQFATIQQMVLRSMQLAIYSPDNVGHFGLHYPSYLHFTSPIRRYPDLITHRAIKSVLKNHTFEYPYNINTMGQHTSFTERRAEDLERKIDSFYKCQYAKTHIGSSFQGNVTAIVSFGLFVYLPELMLDGLVHVTALGGEYFTFNEAQQTLRSQPSGIQFHNGQTIKIKIAYVDMTNLFIDFELDKS